MKKGLFRIFAICTALNFFFIGATAWFTNYRESAPLELFFLVVLGALVVSLGITLSYHFSMEPDSAEGLGSEAAEGAASIADALKMLISAPYALIWLVTALLVGGHSSLAEGKILGGVAIVAGQIFWAGARAPLRAVTSSLRIPPAVADWLRWILTGMDGAVVLSVALLVGSVGAYATVLDRLLAIELAACLAAALALARWRRIRRGGVILAIVQFMLLWCWACPALLALNFALDAHEPIHRHLVSFRDCPSRGNNLFSNSNERIPENADTTLFVSCELFAAATSPSMADQVETVLHKGAFGVAWAKSHLLPKQTP